MARISVALSCVIFFGFAAYSSSFPQQPPARSDADAAFVLLTESRLRAATVGARTEWEKPVAANVVVIDQAGVRQNKDQFWKLELSSCKDIACKAEDFKINTQPGIATVTYSLIVDASKGKELVQSVDTYVLLDSSWKMISGFRTIVPNARKPRFRVDPAILQSYAGKYADKLGRVYEVVLTDDKLFVRKSGEIAMTELIPQSPSTFCVVGDEAVTEFVKSNKGTIAGIVIRIGTSEQNLTRVR